MQLCAVKMMRSGSSVRSGSFGQTHTGERKSIMEIIAIQSPNSVTGAADASASKRATERAIGATGVNGT